MSAQAAPPPAPRPPARGRHARGGSGTGRRVAAAGAVAAQFSQALGSLLLSVVAVRALAPADFGVLGLLLGLLVLATALMTGFVGDSLTVLDRFDPAVRAGLQVWAAGIAGGLVVVGAGGTLLAGLLDPVPAALFGLALGAFVLEEVARRLLMATLRFWALVAVDLTYLAVAALVLAGAEVAGRVTLSDVLAALLVGQAVATVAALGLLPAAERRPARLRGAALRPVAAFGGWRAFQQGIRPAALTVLRLVVLAAAGRAALGGLESARVYVSPALLLVQGAGGFLLVTYALDRQSSAAAAVRTADRAAALLVGGTVVVGAVAVLGLPWLGPLLTGDPGDGGGIGALAVAGWATYAASVAATMPYASLSAVRGRQVAVVGRRLADTALSLAAAGVVVAVVAEPAPLTPFALALGSAAGALLQRRLGLSARSEA